jgi:Ca2+-binding RTX toxin-like protein
LIEYNFVTNVFKAEFNGPGLNGNGDDTIYGTKNSVDIVFGGGGNDKIFGIHPDEKAGVIDVDVLFGNDGDDNIYGGSGANLLVGGDGNDNLFGGNRINFMLGDGYSLATGNPLDNFNALKSGRVVLGNGWIPEGSGQDYIVGGSGIDFISGGYLRDIIRAGDGFNKGFHGSERSGANHYAWLGRFR